MNVDDSEVKGAYFVVARRHLLDNSGHDALERAVELMGPHGDALRSPMASGWYPESTMRASLHAVFEAACASDRDEYRQAIEQCTVMGTHRFFRVLLGITSPKFFLKNYPTVYKQLRRGPAQVRVEPLPSGAIVRFEHQPFCDDELYRIAFEAGFHVVFDLMKRPRPSVEVGDVAETSLTLRLGF